MVFKAETRQERWHERQRQKGFREHHHYVREEETVETPVRIFYYEVSLLSTRSKVFIDFTDSGRNTATDAEITSSYTPEEPLSQLKIYNDGTADYIRFSVNEGTGSAPNIKLKFGENMTVPFNDLGPYRKIRTLTVQAITSNATLRIIGIV